MLAGRGTARAADGLELAVTRFPAQGHVIGSVLTFDYRGMGWSRTSGLRGFEANVSTWIRDDFNAMQHEARAAAPRIALMVVGHSLGGQILGAGKPCRDWLGAQS